MSKTKQYFKARSHILSLLGNELIGSDNLAIFELVKNTKPDVLAVEKIYAHWQYPTTAYALGHARGVVCLVCSNLNVHLAEYGATKIKKAIVGNGRAAKTQVQRMVQQTLQLKEMPEPDDISDALAVAIAHYFISESSKRIYADQSCSPGLRRDFVKFCKALDKKI